MDFPIIAKCMLYWFCTLHHTSTKLYIIIFKKKLFRYNNIFLSKLFKVRREMKKNYT